MHVAASTSTCPSRLCSPRPNLAKRTSQSLIHLQSTSNHHPGTSIPDIERGERYLCRSTPAKNASFADLSLSEYEPGRAGLTAVSCGRRGLDQLRRHHRCPACSGDIPEQNGAPCIRLGRAHEFVNMGCISNLIRLQASWGGSCCYLARVRVNADHKGHRVFACFTCTRVRFSLSGLGRCHRCLLGSGLRRSSSGGAATTTTTSHFPVSKNGLQNGRPNAIPIFTSKTAIPVERYTAEAGDY